MDDNEHHQLAGHGPRGPETFEEALCSTLSRFADVIELRRLLEEERDRLTALEHQAQEQGAAGGIIPFVNEGVHEALAADIVFAATTGPMYNDMPVPWTMMLDEEDTVIGEWLPEGKIAAAKEGGRCIFLSQDFVMYKDRRSVGPSRFVMPFICLPLDDDSPMSLCGLGSPSPPGDEYIRRLMGNPGPKVATMLVGVRLKDAIG